MQDGVAEEGFLGIRGDLYQGGGVGGGVGCADSAAGAQHGIIAGFFAFDGELAAGQPGKRMEPIKGAGEAGELSREQVVAADVGQLVGENNSVPLVGGPGGTGAGGGGDEDAPAAGRRSSARGRRGIRAAGFFGGCPRRLLLPPEP